LNIIGITQKSHNRSHTWSSSIAAVITICLMGFWCNIGNAAQVTLAWDAATDPALAGYKVYFGTQTGQYSHYVDASTSTAIVIPDLTEGQIYYFAATAYDASGIESSYSNEVSYSVPASLCTYAISPASQTFSSSGGTISITVSTQAGCSWAANSNAWMTITSGANGSGNGTVKYSVSANTTASTRYTSLTIANQTFTATQNGVSAYTITASAGTGGSISPSGTTTVSSGSSQTYSITPTSGYSISSVTVDGSSVGAVSSYTFSNVTANHTVSASFTAASYTLTKSISGTGSGTVTSSPTGTSFASGTTVSLTATPATGSTFSGWTGACSGTSTTCTLTMNSNKTATATFSKSSYTITASAGTGGSISPSGTTTVGSGSSQTYKITSTSGYSISSVIVDGSSVGAVSSYTFSNVTANHTVSASFTLQKSYTISATAQPGGTITPSGTASIAKGGSATYVITPKAGYTIKYIQVDSTLIRSCNSYTFSNVAANHTIKAWFTSSTTLNTK
jgi:uncharacterized repeat protein (TIGR02543 family)